MLDITFLTVLALVIWSMFKSHSNPGKIVSDAEKAYRELMEEIGKCDSLSTLISCQSKIDHFRDNQSWKIIDGCDMVDSLQEYYNQIYDNIVYEQYSF